MNWTQGEYDEYLKKHGKVVDKPKTKVQKYKNKGTWYDGLYFRSQLEMRRYCQLKIWFNTGQIAGFITQPKFILQEGNEKEQAISYSADFLILNNDGTYEVEDTKGMATAQWNRTYKQFKLRYSKVDLKVLKEV